MVFACLRRRPYHVCCAHTSFTLPYAASQAAPAPAQRLGSRGAGHASTSGVQSPSAAVPSSAAPGPPAYSRSGRKLKLTAAALESYRASATQQNSREAGALGQQQQHIGQINGPADADGEVIQTAARGAPGRGPIKRKRANTPDGAGKVEEGVKQVQKLQDGSSPRKGASMPGLRGKGAVGVSPISLEPGFVRGSDDVIMQDADGGVALSSTGWHQQQSVVQAPATLRAIRTSIVLKPGETSTVSDAAADDEAGLAKIGHESQKQSHSSRQDSCSPNFSSSSPLIGTAAPGIPQSPMRGSPVHRASAGGNMQPTPSRLQLTTAAEQSPPPETGRSTRRSLAFSMQAGQPPAGLCQPGMQLRMGQAEITGQSSVVLPAAACKSSISSVLKQSLTAYVNELEIGASASDRSLHRSIRPELIPHCAVCRQCPQLQVTPGHQVQLLRFDGKAQPVLPLKQSTGKPWWITVCSILVVVLLCAMGMVLACGSL